MTERAPTASPNTSQYVKLNVGGWLFQTTISTLTKWDCMLKAMFSGRMEVLYDADGYVLIDRCGKHFSHVLNFLRQGTVPLPECRVEVEEILLEARYYLIQELIDHCVSWLDYLDRAKTEPVGVSHVPVVVSRRQVEAVIKTCLGRPVIELLINRQNNKYSYTQQSDENFLRNQELFDKLLLRFNNRVLFIKNIGVGSSEMCQWTFYGNANRKVEICCTSIVYATDKKQTKVEFPEARIFEEAMNTLLTYDQESTAICSKCRSETATATVSSGTDPVPPSLFSQPFNVNPKMGDFFGAGNRVEWRMDHLTLGPTPSTSQAENRHSGGGHGHYGDSDQPTCASRAQNPQSQEE